MMNASDDGNGDGNHPSENNPNDNEQKKKGKGRQKITMAKIENETNLQVTFSKRRAGVFKKASELSTLCGAESAVVVFSPGNKPHSFGHPNVDAVANRFLNAVPDPPARPTTAADQVITAHNEAAMQQNNQKLAAIEAEMAREKQRKKELDSLSSAGHAPPRLDELGYEELEQLRKSVLLFQSEFEAKVSSGGGQGSSSTWNHGSGSGGGGGGATTNLAADSVSGGLPPVYGYGYDYGYGYGGGGSSNISMSNNINNNINNNVGNSSSYGYTVQYPPLAGGGSAYNYGGEPSAVVPYDAGTGSSDADADANREAADDVNKFLGFGTDYRGPDF